MSESHEVKEPLLANGGRTGTSVSINTGTSSRVVERIKKSYNVKSLFTIKPIEAFIEERESRPEGSSLAERLGLIDLLGYGVGCTVGAGIYSLIGIGAGIAGIKWFTQWAKMVVITLGVLCKE